MELQIIWNDVGDMDTPYVDLNQSQYQTVPDDEPIKYRDWLVETTSLSEEGYPWTYCKGPKSQSLTSDGAEYLEATRSISAAVGDNGPTMHRKRKYWEEDDGEPRKLANLDDDAEQGGTAPGDEEAKEPKSKESGSPAARMTSSWDLAADLEGSFSGLGGVDLSTASYNMSEALLALPPLPVLKQEAPSPTSHNDNRVPGPNSAGVREADSNTPSFKNVLSSSQGGSSSSLHQLLQSNYNNVSSTVVASVPGQNHLDASGEAYQLRGTKTAAASSTTTLQDLGIDCRFQYVLAAATSIATKVNEETLTYLNQGQSYEIKLKKLGELSAYRGKILKSVIRICFHERRLQYMEQEQMAAWRASRPGERIVEIDVPLSYGIGEATQDPWMLNTVDFLWDPTKEVGVYIKVNCISTEFTPKKHGGEKGVPFRIQVETYIQGEEGSITRLHAAACQIKVFKLKGGDRKHKQDREKIQKRPAVEQEKYQPSYDCTVLSDIPSELLYPASLSCAVSSSMPVYTSADTCLSQSRTTVTPTSSSAHLAPIVPKDELAPQLASLTLPDGTGNLSPDQQNLSPQDIPRTVQTLSSEASSQHLAVWLQTHRFNAYIRTFSSFSGEDILRLSRDDVIQICGLPDGIRLYNALHSKTIPPQLTIYLCVEQSPPPEHHALFLHALSAAELTEKLAQLLGVTFEQILKIHIQGPGGMHVIVTDDVVRNVKEDSMFSIEVIPDQSGARCRILLKPMCP